MGQCDRIQAGNILVWNLKTKEWVSPYTFHIWPLPDGEVVDCSIIHLPDACRSLKIPHSRFYRYQVVDPELQDAVIQDMLNPLWYKNNPRDVKRFQDWVFYFPGGDLPSIKSRPHLQAILIEKTRKDGFIKKDDFLAIPDVRECLEYLVTSQSEDIISDIEPISNIYSIRPKKERSRSELSRSLGAKLYFFFRNASRQNKKEIFDLLTRYEYCPEEEKAAIEQEILNKCDR
jgi:hypothetical protein